MNIDLSGPEIHAIRDLMEEAIIDLDNQIRKAPDQKTTDALKTRRDDFRHIMDKLPAEFGTVS